MGQTDPEKSREYSRKYYHTHREVVRARQNSEKGREYARSQYYKHKESVAARRRERHQNNPELNKKAAAKNAEYRAANPEKVKASKKKSNARRKEHIAEHHHEYYLKNKERLSARKRAYAEKNRERIVAQRKQYYNDNREKILARNAAYLAIHGQPPDPRTPEDRKKYYEENRPKMLARAKAYRDANKELVTENNRLYKQKRTEPLAAARARQRARKRNAYTDFTPAQWKEMQERYDHRCVYCNRRSKGHLTMDHLQPLAKGGSHTLANILPACRSCNSKKNVNGVLKAVQPLLITVAPAKPHRRQAKVK